MSSLLSMSFAKPASFLPVNYKPKKYHHMVYLDIENTGISDGFVEKTLKKLKLKELTVSCGNHCASLLETVKSKCNIDDALVYSILFDGPEKDKADNFLLTSMNKDGSRYAKLTNVVFILISNDKLLQKKFIDKAIHHGVGYKIESRVH